MKRMCSEPGTHTPVCWNTAAFMYTVNSTMKSLQSLKYSHIQKVQKIHSYFKTDIGSLILTLPPFPVAHLPHEDKFNFV